jgi:hypothetical protein
MMWGPALGYKMAELIAEGRVSALAKEDIELASPESAVRGDEGRDRLTLSEKVSDGYSGRCIHQRTDIELML